MQRTIVALDISTKTGFAVFHIQNDEIKKSKFDTIFPDKTTKDFGSYPFNYLDLARHIGGVITSEVSLLKLNHPEIEVVIEETTCGRNNLSQKMLEFIHYSVLTGLEAKKIPVTYVRTGVWRKKVGASLTDDEKKLNAKIRRIKSSTGQRLAKIEGKVVGKFTKKHAALRCFKEHFGYELPMKMNDACEAALLGLAYFKGCSHCDGTIGKSKE